jgi:hypothetical protein
MIQVLEDVLTVLDKAVKGGRQLGKQKSNTKVATTTPEPVVNPFEGLDVRVLSDQDTDDAGDILQKINRNALSQSRKAKQKEGKTGRSPKAKRPRRADVQFPVSDEDVAAEQQYDLEMTKSEVDWLLYSFFQGRSRMQSCFAAANRIQDFHSMREFLQK